MIISEAYIERFNLDEMKLDFSWILGIIARKSHFIRQLYCRQKNNFFYFENYVKTLSFLSKSESKLPYLHGLSILMGNNFESEYAIIVLREAHSYVGRRCANYRQFED